MTIVLGEVPASSTLYIPSATYGNADPASITMSGLAVTDIEIYKNGSTTQRASDNGYTLLDTDGIDFDGITGIHGFSIDLSDNSDSGFYAVGSVYWVVISSITVDSKTVNFIAAVFRIKAAESVAGKPKVDVDAFGGTAGTFSGGRPEVNTTHLAGTAYGSADFNATMKASINAEADQAASDYGALKPTVAGRTFDVTSGGCGGVDWANVENQGAAVSLSMTSVSFVDSTDTCNDATVTAIGGDVINAAAIAASAVTEIQSGLATSAELAKVPKSDSTVSWNSTALAAIQTQANNALVANDLDHLTKTGLPTSFAVDVHVDSALGQLAQTADGGYSRATDSLEAIRDRGDAAWTTGGGGGGSDAQLLQDTTIATLTSQTVFTLTDGSADNDAYNCATCVIIDQSTTTQKAFVTVSDYVGSTKTLTLSSTPEFTVAAGDTIKIIATPKRLFTVADTTYSTILERPVALDDSESTDGTMEIVQGDTYDGSTYSKPKKGVTVTTDFTGSTVTFSIKDKYGTTLLTKAGTVASSTRIEVSLTATETAALTIGLHKYDFSVTNGSTVNTQLIGTVEVIEDVT